MTDKNDRPEETGFIIVDKRIGAKKSNDKSSTEADQEASGSEKKGEHEGASFQREEKPDTKASKQTPLPEIDFSSFIISLSTSVYIHLGDIPDPVTNKTVINLAMAKQTIDIIAMLKEKTEGNLTKEEDQIIDDMLYNLRMKFVAASGKSS